MKQPTDGDFTVDVLASGGGVTVLFKPTQSYYTFNRLADPKDIKRFGPLSPDGSVRHAGPTGDTGDCRFFRRVSGFIASSIRHGGSLGAIARARPSFGLSARSQDAY